ncbi:DUF1697 domain-containing protein [Ornithinimicrobium cryptoxanthini]|uniref:DUF1697 domain-containing protein n=1 Tax=Ornithinimicrobium cryptoxanthini TaxID=2934161 RepID=UPI00211850B3|nr:DUF1697 domain-containing protein [Ornithinimicrobium cryptoxanthini]
MPTYVGFLRAINLGARRKFPAGAVRASAEGAGFADVETYLNTGNVRVGTRMRSLPRVEAALEAAFEADRGFEVPTIVYGSAELTELAEYAATLDADFGATERHMVYLLRDPVAPEMGAELEALSNDRVRIVAGPRSMHALWPVAVAGDPDPLSSAAGRRLGLTTTRNVRVVTEVARRWG